MSDFEPAPADTVPSDPVRPVRLLIADDDQILLGALRTSFGRREEVTLVDAVDSGISALAVLASKRVDLALIDVDMPGMDGIQTVRRIRELHPDVTVVMYTNFEQEGSLEKALSAGAHGFLTKDVSFDTLFQGVLRAYQGAPVMASRPVEILVDYFKSHPANNDVELRHAIEGLPSSLRSVLDELIQGHPNKIIAENLGLTPGTVRVYVSDLLSRTECDNRSQLAARAARLGF